MAAAAASIAPVLIELGARKAKDVQMKAAETKKRLSEMKAQRDKEKQEYDEFYAGKTTIKAIVVKWKDGKNYFDSKRLEATLKAAKAKCETKDGWNYRCEGEMKDIAQMVVKMSDVWDRKEGREPITGISIYDKDNKVYGYEVRR